MRKVVSFHVQKIAKYARARLPALFGVELHAEEVAARECRAERPAVVGHGDGLRAGFRGERVYVIDIRPLVQPVEQRRPQAGERVPAHVGDLDPSAVRRGGGALHPITIVKNEMIDVFAGMGFEIYEGPEIEDDDHNFTRLNVAKNHPARDMQDTFYVAEDIVLRTHTSPGQIRVMDAQKPPIKVLVPGRVFRSDSDATHSPMFHQMEGLVVDKGITLCDLQGMLDKFVQTIFSSDVKTRLRPSYFPFTEPSVEVDVSCFECGGKGCPLCKHTGWIEVLGGGVVHHKVLENCGIDPNVYSGIAFGIGIERIAMLKYGINNMGLLFENDLRFLKQFKDEREG